jgi:uncharacterized phage protein (TIGR02220 family)
MESGEIWMTEIQNFIGESSTEADRIREYRNGLKQKQLEQNVQMYDRSTPELEKEKKKEIKTEKEHIPYTDIINYLNEKTNSRYKPTTSKNRELIKSRWNEGFDLDDFKTAIDKKCKEWKGTEFEQYLRPQTLFGTKFESYLNQKVGSKIKSDINNSSANLEGVDEL